MGEDAETKKTDDAKKPDMPAEAAHETPGGDVHEKHAHLAREHREALMRLQAEYENYRKRTAKDLAESAERGAMGLAADMLPVLDEFEHSLEHLDGKEREGFAMVLSNMRKALEAHGVMEMAPLGKKYDPYAQEMVGWMQGGEEGNVGVVVRKGYMFGRHVLRHAQVMVFGKKKEKKLDAEDDEKKVI
jgi:molecular chaperone GrpE